MKLRKSFVVVGGFALALCVAFAPIAAQGVRSLIQGVTEATIHVINGNKDRNTKIAARPNDVIQINLALKANPLTTRVTVGSNNPSVVQALPVRRLNNINGPSGSGGNLVARYLAKQRGTATLTFVIARGKTDFTIVRTEVEVK
jgi:hypothetical protein